MSDELVLELQDMRERQKSVARQIAHYLDNLKYRSTGRDPKCNGYAYAEVPEWALRQMREALEAEMKRAGESSA